MTIAAPVLDAPTKLDFYVGCIASATGISRIIEAVQGYLESWSKGHVASLQKMDGGWAPFDERQRPLPVVSASAVHCVRDSIQGHCMALREAGMAPTPELVELGEFFYTASRMLESYGEAALQWRSGASRMPPEATRHDVLQNG